MRKTLSIFLFVVLTLVAVSPVLATPGKGRNAGCLHGIVMNVDGEDYYLAGPSDGPGGTRDVPGHYWVLAGPNMLVGKHYNIDLFGAP